MTRAALVVGINTYRHFQNLTAPAKDAEAIAQRLRQEGDFKVIRLPEAIVEVGDQRSPVVGERLKVTQAQLEAALKQLFRPDSNQIPDTALFYFSGHGLPDPEGKEGLDKGYLAASNTDPHQTRPGVSLAWLQNLLAHSPIPNQIVWLDCCHSGGLLVDVSAANPGHGDRYSRCFIASSRDFEQSWQDLNSPYSVLTKALLDGLDPKRLPHRWVDTFALVDYVNQGLKGELQSPVCTNFGDAINLTRTQQLERVESASVVADSGICPYKGLEFFDCNDADPKYFFGREALTSELLAQVLKQPFMALVGASGNGKSSVLRAGLLHQLKLGKRIAGSDQWQILLTRPDNNPMKNLAEAFLPENGTQIDRAEALGRATGLLKEGGPGLARLVSASPAPRVVLVIDQFEEVFTRSSAAERERFFACLMGALAEAGDKLRLILAMRADFVGKCLEQAYDGLAERVPQAMVSVLPLTEPELRSAICKPAEQVGLTVEDALVTEILSDIQGAPGSLPLLQYTLTELWARRKDNQLRLADYIALGRIQGTLDTRATELYNSFAPAEQATVKHIFQQLTQLGEGTEDTRRRVFLDNLIAAPKHPIERVNQVIATLSDQQHRLLVTSDVVSKGQGSERHAIVDVAHEALIRHWRLLRQWVDQNRDLLRQQRRIEASAVTWQEHDLAKGYLLQGFPLKEALRFQKQHADTLPLSDIARSFLDKSRWQRRWSQLRIASLLLLFAPIVDYALYRQNIDQYYSKIGRADKAVERESAIFLTQHCRQRWGKLTNYLTYRANGEYCYSLADRIFNGGANLREVKLISANLRSADLSDANLSDANLSDADLRDANLRDTDLSNANFSNADLSDAYLRDAYLSDANLSDANLISAYLRYAYLRDAYLSNANLRYAYLSNADLSNADLSNANLISADLRSADLRNADFRAAYLSDADLSSSILLAAHLRESLQLTPDQFTTGEDPPLLCNTTLPQDILDAGVDPDQDCDRIVNIFRDRYRISPEEAQRWVDEARQKQWD